MCTGTGVSHERGNYGAGENPQFKQAGVQDVPVLESLYPGELQFDHYRDEMRVKACMVDNYSTLPMSNLAHQSELALLAEMFDPMYGIFSPPAKTRGET